MQELASSPVAEVADFMRLTGPAFDAAMTYQDHLWAILEDEACVLHVVVAPFSPLPRSVIPLHNDDGAFEALDGLVGGADVLDGVVVLGKPSLAPVEDEDDLAAAAIEDVAEHLFDICPAVDRTTGWLRRDLSRAAVELAMTAAHPVLGNQPERLGRILRRTHARMAENPHSGGPEALEAQNPGAMEFLRRFGRLAEERRGFWITLPSDVVGILDPVKTAVCEVMDELERRPTGVV